LFLITITAAVLKAFFDFRRQQLYADLLVLNDLLLADLGLRRLDVLGELWQPTGKVDGYPPIASIPSHARVFGDAWLQTF
jgi:hypothetical protein